MLEKNAVSAAAWKPSRWLPVYGEICRQHLEGRSAVEIAATVHLSERHVRRTLGLRDSKAYLAMLEAAREQQVQALYRAAMDFLPDAVLVQAGVMQDAEARDRDRLSAAQDLLDRFGMPKQTRHEVSAPPQSFTIVTHSRNFGVDQLMAPSPELVAEVVTENPIGDERRISQGGGHGSEWQDF